MPSPMSSLKVSVMDSAPTLDLDPSLDRRRFRSNSIRRYNLQTLAIAAGFGFFLCYLLESVFQTTPLVRSSLSIPSTSSIAFADPTARHDLVRPENDKVIGLIFYGRPMFVNVLDCYLRQNLRENGGWLDEVHFIANTEHKDDLVWLDTLVKTTSSYIKVDNLKGPWTKLWTYLDDFDPETIFVKIDDDVVYMHEEAVPRLVSSLIAHPEAYAVGGHIVNTPHSQFWQYHTGSLLPYLPDPEPVSEVDLKDWRPSNLPLYAHEYPPTFNWTLHARPQHNITRWLPLAPTALQNSSDYPDSSRFLVATPAWNASWPSPRGGWTMFTYAPEIESWAMATQLHYSLLTHLESPSTLLSKYTFLTSTHLWNQQYERYSVNFMAIRAGRMARQPLFVNDEVGITMAVSKEHQEPFLIDTGALVSHFAFGTQHKVLGTDVLERYLAYANEMVCGRSRQKTMVRSNMTRTAH